MYKFNIKRNLTIALIVSIAVSVLILTLTVDYKLLATINLEPLLIAGFLTIILLLLKGIRMYILSKICGCKVSVLESILVRSGSEFIALISLSYTGDELFRMWYLNKIGINIKYAIWIAYLDLFLDVVIGSLYGLAAGVHLITSGINSALGIIIILLVIVILSSHLAIFLILLRGGNIAKNISNSLAKYRILSFIEKWLKDKIREAEQAEKLPRSTLVKVVFIAFLISLVIGVIAGLILHFSLKAAGVNLGIIDSIYAVFTALTITALPITIGGSGITEASIALYTTPILGSTPWLSIVTYRFVSYHLSLLVTGLCLSILIYKYKKEN